MQDIDDQDLITVTGGASTASKNNNTELEFALKNLQSDLKDLSKPQQNQTNQLFTVMAFGLLARRLA